MNTIYYNLTVSTEPKYIPENVLFVSNMEDYGYFKSKYRDKIVEYVPDSRFLTWSEKSLKINNLIVRTNIKPILTIIAEEGIIPPKINDLVDTLRNVYTIVRHGKSNYTDDYIRDIVSHSDLVICQNYISHLACIIYEIPFISIMADIDTKMLMKDIGIEKLRFNKCKRITHLINNWIHYRNIIHEYNTCNIKYIKNKLKKYNG